MYIAINARMKKDCIQNKSHVDLLASSPTPFNQLGITSTTASSNHVHKRTQYPITEALQQTV